MVAHVLVISVVLCFGSHVKYSINDNVHSFISNWFILSFRLPPSMFNNATCIKGVVDMASNGSSILKFTFDSEFPTQGRHVPLILGSTLCWCTLVINPIFSLNWMCKSLLPCMWVFLCFCSEQNVKMETLSIDRTPYGYHFFILSRALSHQLVLPRFQTQKGGD